MEIKTNKTIHRLTLLTLCAIAALQPGLAGAMEKNEELNKLLLSACKFGPMVTVKKYLEMGADINTTDGDCNTPLMLAIKYNQPELIKLLIEKDAQVNVNDSDGDTPLMVAIKYHHPETAKFLVEVGANTRLINNEGETAMQIAQQKNHTAIIPYLTLFEDLLTTIDNPDAFDTFAEKYLDLNDTKQVEQNLTDIIGILAPRIASIGKEFREKLFNWMQKNNKLLLERNKDQDNKLEKKWFFLELVYQAAVTATHTKHALLYECFNHLKKPDTAFSEAVNACISLMGVWEKKQNTDTKEQRKERQKGRDALKKEKDKRVEQNNLFASTACTKKLFIPKKLPQVPVLKNENAPVNKNATVTKGDEKFTDSDFGFEEDN